MLKPGDIVNGKYRIDAAIGEGGMGTVYAAQHLELGTPVALKFLHRDVSGSGVVAQRFLQEARISAQIHSPYVTRVTDVDTTPQGGAYIVMERLHGESLQALLDREGRLDIDSALDIAIQTLVGVEAAHAIGVVHRDLKPDNIFLVDTPGGPHVKLLDFGIAKARVESPGRDYLTQPGSFMGTPEYMAPEQAFSADTASPRSDLFAVGVLLYRMISGRLPVEGADPLAVASQHATGNTPRLNRLNPTVPDALATLVHDAMSPSVERRPTDAQTMRSALTPFASRLSRPGRIAAEPTDGVGAFSVVTTAGGTVPVKQMPVPSEANTRREREVQFTSAATPPPTEGPSEDSQPSEKGHTAKVTTLPAPEGPPPATANPKNLSARNSTQDMPRASRAVATEQMKATPPEVSTAMNPTTEPKAAAEPASSNAWIWILLVLFIAGGAAAGGFIYVQQTDIGPPPPLPTAPGASPAQAVSPTTAAPAAPTSVPASPAAASPHAAAPSPAAPSPAAAAASPQPTSAATASPTSTSAAATPTTTPTIPTTLPTALPPGLPSSLPAGLPTAIPTTLPTTVPPLPTAIPTAIPTAPPAQ